MNVWAKRIVDKQKAHREKQRAELAAYYERLRVYRARAELRGVNLNDLAVALAA